MATRKKRAGQRMSVAPARMPLAPMPRQIIQPRVLPRVPLVAPRLLPQAPRLSPRAPIHNPYLAALIAATLRRR